MLIERIVNAVLIVDVDVSMNRSRIPIRKFEKFKVQEQKG